MTLRAVNDRADTLKTSRRQVMPIAKDASYEWPQARHNTSGNIHSSALAYVRAAPRGVAKSVAVI